MATIRKRPGPQGRTVWQVQIIRQGFPPQYRTFDSKTQADAWTRRMESEMDAGVWRDRSEADRTTIEDALDRYLAEITPHKAPQTIEWQHMKAKALKSHKLARTALSRIGGTQVSDYIRFREGQGLNAHTILGELSLLSSLYNVARTTWGMSYLVNPVPLAKAAKPKTPPGRERRLEGEEEARLIEAASPELTAVIRFALTTAMRRGEIASLQWNQVDLKRRCLALGAATTKNRTARTVPLSPDAIAVLQSIPRRLDGSVFGMTANAIRLAWTRAIAKTGIRDLRFHDLRHEAISRLFENTDLDLMEIRQISGHKTLQMLSRYTHLRTSRLADRLAGAPRLPSKDH